MKILQMMIPEALFFFAYRTSLQNGGAKLCHWFG